MIEIKESKIPTVKTKNPMQNTEMAVKKFRGTEKGWIEGAPTTTEEGHGWVAERGCGGGIGGG